MGNVFRRRNFLKASLVAPFAIGAILGTNSPVKSQTEGLGFLIPTVNEGPLYFTQDIADSYMGAMKGGFGANAVAFQARSDFDGQRTFPKGNDPLIDDRAKIYAQTAIELGLKPYLQRL